MKCILRLRSNPRGQKQYVVVNVTIKYYFILCCINVKADLHWTVRPGPISKHKLTVNRKTGTIFQVGLRFPFRQKESWPAPKSIIDYRWLYLRAGVFTEFFHNPRTYKEGHPPPPEVFWSFFLNEQTSAPAVFSSYWFIPCTHFETEV